MICPYCGRHNLSGVELCETCHAEIAVVPSRPPRNVLEDGVESDTVMALKPAKPVTVSPTTKVAEVIQLLATRNIGCVLVVFADTLVGIFTERDVLMRIGDRFAEVAEEPIRHFMTPAPETLTPQDGLAFLLNRMAVGGYRHIPIEKDERTIGVISARDMLGYTTAHFPEILQQTN